MTLEFFKYYGREVFELPLINHDSSIKSVLLYMNNAACVCVYSHVCGMCMGREVVANTAVCMRVQGLIQDFLEGGLLYNCNTYIVSQASLSSYISQH